MILFVALDLSSYRVLSFDAVAAVVVVALEDCQWKESDVRFSRKQRHRHFQRGGKSRRTIAVVDCCYLSF